MTEKQNIKKHFEAILGLAIEPEEEVQGDMALREYIGIGTSLEYGFSTSKDISIVGDHSKHCSWVYVLDVSGRASTDPDGNIEFLLSEFHCLSFDLSRADLQNPVHIIATPLLGSDPVLLSTYGIVTSDNDVKIKVRAWNLSGEPVKKSFYWRCRVPYTEPTSPDP